MDLVVADGMDAEAERERRIVASLDMHGVTFRSDGRSAGTGTQGDFERDWPYCQKEVEYTLKLNATSQDPENGIGVVGAKWLQIRPTFPILFGKGPSAS